MKAVSDRRLIAVSHRIGEKKFSPIRFHFICYNRRRLVRGENEHEIYWRKVINAGEDTASHRRKYR